MNTTGRSATRANGVGRLWQHVPVILLGLLVLSSFGSAVSRTGPYQYSGRAVLQIWDPGDVVPWRPADRIPEVTLWADGRVVFPGPDGVIRQARLEPHTMARLIEAARVLYQMKDHYSASGSISVHGSTFFTVETRRGRKTVEVSGMDLEKRWAEEQDPETLEGLRALYREVSAALPAQAPAMQPNEVMVTFHPVSTWVAASEDWPPELSGHITGEPAREAARLSGMGNPRVFNLCGTHPYGSGLCRCFLYCPFRAATTPVGPAIRRPRRTSFLTLPRRSTAFPGCRRQKWRYGTAWCCPCAAGSC